MVCTAFCCRASLGQVVIGLVLLLTEMLMVILVPVFSLLGKDSFLHLELHSIIQCVAQSSSVDVLAFCS